MIGGSGSNINRIRAIGVSVKASDTEMEDKIVVIDGRPKDVARAFEMVVDSLEWSSGQTDTVRLLVESRNAGKVLGSKGATIKGIQSRSRATFVKLANDPIDLSEFPFAFYPSRECKRCYYRPSDVSRNLCWGRHLS